MAVGRPQRKYFFAIYRFDMIEIELEFVEFDPLQIKVRFYNRLGSMRSEFGSLTEPNPNLDFSNSFWY